MKDRKIMFTAFAIFLLMSAAPLQAARVQSADEAVQHHALGGGAHESANLVNQEKFGPFGVSCDALQQRFLRLRNETNAALTLVHSGGTLSFAAQVSFAMKMRGMLGTSRRAASRECEWMGDSNVLDHQQQLKEIAAMSPCASTARQMVESASDLEEEQQQVVFRQAVLVLMSPTCEIPEENEDDSVDEDSENEIIDEVDELAEELTETALSCLTPVAHPLSSRTRLLLSLSSSAQCWR